MSTLKNMMLRQGEKLEKKWNKKQTTKHFICLYYLRKIDVNLDSVNEKKKAKWLGVALLESEVFHDMEVNIYKIMIDIFVNVCNIFCIKFQFVSCVEIVTKQCLCLQLDTLLTQVSEVCSVVAPSLSKV